MVFDNGVYNGPGGGSLSRIVEYAYDEQAMTVEEVWSYPEPSGDSTNLMGDAKKLENGHVLASWADIGIFQEIDPATDTPVWTADIKNGQGLVTRLSPMDAL